MMLQMHCTGFDKEILIISTELDTHIMTFERGQILIDEMIAKKIE